MNDTYEAEADRPEDMIFASKIAADVNLWWRDRYQIDSGARIVREHGRYGVRSNLINGRPREWQTWRKPL